MVAVCWGVFSLKSSSYHFGGLLISSQSFEAHFLICHVGVTYPFADQSWKCHEIIYRNCLKQWRKGDNKQYTCLLLPLTAYYIHWFQLPIPDLLFLESYLTLNHCCLKFSWSGYEASKNRENMFVNSKGKVPGHNLDFESNFLIAWLPIIYHISLYLKPKNIYWVPTTGHVLWPPLPCTFPADQQITLPPQQPSVPRNSLLLHSFAQGGKFPSLPQVPTSILTPRN